MKRKKRTFLVAGAVALASVVTACGDDGPARTDADEYTEGVCEALDKVGGEMAAMGEEFEEQFEDADESDLDEIRDAVADLFDEGAERMGEAAEDVQKLGVPDVDDGDDIASAMNELLAEIVEELEQLADSMRELDTSDPEEFKVEAEELAEKMTETLGARAEEIGEDVPAAVELFEGTDCEFDG
jgi:ElaB/YqjD/DUF883 family membrane-anchored ribosome-binding protein